jgi:hypothetical protein
VGKISRYEVRFTATNSEDVSPDLAERLGAILATLPGVESGSGGQLEGPRTIIGVVELEVEQAMAEAARDGSRLAKEALGMAGMPDAKLIELQVRVVEDRD